MINRNRIFIAGLFILTFTTSGLLASGIRNTDDGLSIVSSTSIVTDVVRNIAGNRINVAGLIPQGANPHNYQPTPREMAMAEKADLIFINGMGLEETLSEILNNVKKGKIIEVSSQVNPMGFQDDENNNNQDPHTWTSPLNVISWSKVIRDALIEIDPDNAETYRQNASDYIAKLKELDKEAKEAFSTIDEQDKKLISDHKIFGYFSRDYGFENFGALVPSFSSNAEVSAKEFSHLIEEVNKNKVKAIFIGNTAGDAMKKMGDVLVKEADHPVKLLTIMTGSLAAPGNEGDNYLDYFRFNVNQIVKGLK